MRPREENIKPWGYISPFATKTLRDRAQCDLTITRKQTHNITMPLYTKEQLREAERRAEQRVRAEIGRDSERLDWLERKIDEDVAVEFVAFYNISTSERPGTLDGIRIDGITDKEDNIRKAIDAARENSND